MEKKIELPETAIAPFAEGDTAGRAVYLLNGVEIGSVPILYENDVAKAVYKDYLFKNNGILSFVRQKNMLYYRTNWQ